MPVPEDMRRTVKTQLRLSEEASKALRQLPAGKRSRWVSDLIVKAWKRIRRERGR